MAQDPGTAPTQSGDSLDQAAATAVAQVEDTADSESHAPEPAEDDVDSLLEKLKSHADKIPADKLSFLDKKFQPGFTRRLNLLNDEKKALAASAQQMAEKAGVTLSPDIDIFTPEGQKAFVEAIDQMTAARLKPVTDFAEQQKNNQNLVNYLELAKREIPIVAENLKEIAPIFDGDPQLQNLASRDNWAALPLVLEGIGYKVALDKAHAELAEAKKLLKASSVATRTGKTTSRAGGPAPTGGKASRMTLEEAAAEAARRVEQQEIAH